MTIPIIVPIIMPIRSKEDSHKECIVVEDKKYCEVSTGSKEMAGIAVLIIVIMVFWLVWIGYELIVTERFIIGLIIFFAPIICFLAWCFT